MVLGVLLLSNTDYSKVGAMGFELLVYLHVKIKLRRLPEKWGRDGAQPN